MQVKMQVYDWVKYNDRIYQIYQVQQARIRVFDAITCEKTKIPEKDFSKVEIIEEPTFKTGD